MSHPVAGDDQLLPMIDQRKSLDKIPQPAWRCDKSGLTVECNRHWYEYTGQTAEEVRGFGWADVVHRDDKDQLADQLLEAAKTGIFKARYRLRRASDGTYHWHLAQAVRVTDDDGEVTGWIGSAVAI